MNFTESSEMIYILHLTASFRSSSVVSSRTEFHKKYDGHSSFLRIKKTRKIN